MTGGGGMMRTIWFIVFPGFEILDLGGPLCAFNLAAEFHGAAYDVKVVSPTGGLGEGGAMVSIATPDQPRTSPPVGDTTFTS